MNAKVSFLPRAQSSRRRVAIEPTGNGATFAFSPLLAGAYDSRSAALWLRWSPEGVPCFSLDLLKDLERASRAVEAYYAGRQKQRPLQYVVLQSGAAGAFSVGGDLRYFRELILARDQARLSEYARTAVHVVYNNYVAHNLRGVTTFALLEGDALGGGFECALSCDVIVAEDHVKAGFPEILFNMFPGMGGMSFLARRVDRAVAREMVRSGRQYTASELHEVGAVDHVVRRGGGRDAVERIVTDRKHLAAGHAAVNAAERLIRPITRQELLDVATLWVDCAMQLPERGLNWMQRLSSRQRQVFGNEPDVGNVQADRPVAATATA